ncbi:MAG: membrane lipoprotein lipid attachment site-containing protein [Clostridia bacterium]|nr:membrane lipoprotein lipid attachment site-containing protein [Clostridia bacterium]
MKRTILFLTALLMLAAIGCGPAKADDPNTVFIDPNAVRGGEYGDLYFEAYGVRFGIYDETEQVLSALPAYNSTFSEQSCAFPGADVSYSFGGFRIMTNEIDGVSRITGISVKDDTVKTPQGLYIGMSEADARAAFPALPESDWNAEDGTALLSVIVEDGFVTRIEYSPAVGEDGYAIP